MRVLVIGAGFVGTAIARAVLEQGGFALTVSRHRPPGADEVPWAPLDIMDAAACEKILCQVAPDTVVLVHGPSDVTWCEAHPEEAWRGHVSPARRIAELAGNRRVVMISTDNVFDGTQKAPAENSTPCPGNAYGHAKLAAERAIAQAPNAVVLRVSLIYGWEPEGSSKWMNFFASCAHPLLAGRGITVPYDQWSTPVLLEDVAEATLALLRADTVPPLLHLGGPDRISRAAWATLIADRLGVATDLVSFEPRAQGRYASRPPNSGLASDLLHRHPSTAMLRVRGVREGTALLIQQRQKAGVFPC